MSDIFTQRK